MLSREEAKQLLEMAFDAQMRVLAETVGGPYRNSRKGAGKSYQRGKLTEKFVRVQTEEDLYPTAWEHMQSVREGELHQSAYRGEGDRRLPVRVGTAGMI